MDINGILSSPWQRRRFLLATGAAIVICVVAVFVIASFAPVTPFWTTAINLLASIVASAAFAIISILYVSYFFVDPTQESANTTLLPQDIDEAIKRIATSATSYFISVRTGRHFRADTLPILEKQAQKLRRPIEIEVVLLDCRDSAICNKYAEYRRVSSFDKKSWDTQYVQTEILSTILAILDVTSKSGGLVGCTLYLSRRLSSFRIEGSPEEILITREDPKDNASRYLKSHRDFGAHVSDFKWTKEDSFSVRLVPSEKPLTLEMIFGEDHPLLGLEGAARKSRKSASPYAR